MSYSCISSSGDRPAPPEDFMKAVQRPELLRGTPKFPAFAVNGSGYDLLVNRNVPISWTFLHPNTGEVENQPWTYLKIVFADDLDYATSSTTDHTFPVLNPGEETEYFGGVMPLAKMNLLVKGNWYMAVLLASDDTALAYCPFYVLGGV
jgi:hypothetical protein